MKAISSELNDYAQTASNTISELFGTYTPAPVPLPLL